MAASATLTVPPWRRFPNVGDTVDIAGTTYTFVGTTADLTAANDVLIGADVQSTLANLAGAINASTTNGQGAGTTYGTGTSPTPPVTATGSTATTLTLQAIQTGPGGNSLARLDQLDAEALFGAGNLAGGVDAVQAAGTMNVAIPLPTAGQTVSVGGTTYTFAGSHQQLKARPTPC